MINEQIRDKEVRLISADGEQLGIMSARDAYKLAQEAELDLVKIAPTAKPPVDVYKRQALYSDLDPVGTMTTGHDLVNRLIENVRWGLQGNFLDVPTDCPQRDERMGWTGDAQVFSPTATYLKDTYAFYAKYLYDICLLYTSRCV